MVNFPKLLSRLVITPLIPAQTAARAHVAATSSVSYQSIFSQSGPGALAKLRIITQATALDHTFVLKFSWDGNIRFGIMDYPAAQTTKFFRGLPSRTTDPGTAGNPPDDDFVTTTEFDMYVPFARSMDVSLVADSNLGFTADVWA